MNPKKDILRWILSILIFIGVVFVIELIGIGIEYLFNNYRQETLLSFEYGFCMGASIFIIYIIKKLVFDHKY